MTVSTFSLGILAFLNCADKDRDTWTLPVLPRMVGFLPHDPVFQYDRNDSACIHGYLWSQDGSPSNDNSSIQFRLVWSYGSRVCKRHCLYGLVHGQLNRRRTSYYYSFQRKLPPRCRCYYHRHHFSSRCPARVQVRSLLRAIQLDRHVHSLLYCGWSRR